MGGSATTSGCSAVTAFTPSTADVRRQIQDGSLSSGAIDGEAFDRWLDGVKAESRLVGRLAEVITERERSDASS
jgi:hypothetical protein